MITANEKLQEAFIRRAITIERYKSSVVNDIIRFMNTELEPDLLSRIERKLDGTLTKTRLKETEAVVNEIVGTYTGEIRHKMADEMADYAVSEADWLKSSLARALPIELTINTPSVELLSKILDKGLINGRYFADYMKEFEFSTKQSVLQQIRLGVSEGQSVDAIVRRIKGSKASNYSDGILARPRHSIQTLVRTTVAGVMSDTRMEMYEANQDVISQWQFKATLDLRTSVQCVSLDGEVFNIGEGPVPPLHYNCRSSHIPVLKSWKELGFDMKELPAGTRASMDGQVPATMNFEEWIEKKSEAEQNEVLGKGKAELWRSGKIQIKDLVDQKYQPLTLKQVNKNLADELKRLRMIT